MQLSTEKLNDIIDNIPFDTRWGDGKNDKSKLILTGTLLLASYGLIDTFEDVDILIADCSDELWNALLNKFDNQCRHSDYQNNNFKVISGGYVYNVIRNDEYKFGIDNSPILIENVYLNSLKNAIEAKRNMGRSKDNLHFETISPRLQEIIDYRPHTTSLI